MPSKARTPKASGKRRLDAQLDEALDETFPASDPIAVGGATSTEPPLRSADHKAPVIDADDIAAARRPRKPSAR